MAQVTPHLDKVQNGQRHRDSFTARYFTFEHLEPYVEQKERFIPGDLENMSRMVGFIALAIESDAEWDVSQRVMLTQNWEEIVDASVALAMESHGHALEAGE